MVEPRDEDVVLGGCSLNHLHLGEGRAAVGYWLMREACGRGVSSACSPASCDRRTTPPNVGT
jgi:RimJ/RimL family protein N-acetyltransferase